MAAMIRLEVATPERLLLKEQVREVVVPGANGELGILPDHAPLLSELGSGPLVYTVESGEKKYMVVCGGYLEVLPDTVRVLARSAENADQIDIKRAEAALQRANERLLHPIADLDVGRAMNALKRAQARLNASQMAGIAPRA